MVSDETRYYESTSRSHHTMSPARLRSRYSSVPPSFGHVRVSQSVDRDVSSRVARSPAPDRRAWTSVLPPRRYSLSAAVDRSSNVDNRPASGGGGLEDDATYRRTPLVRWSRKDVLYTADNMRPSLDSTFRRRGRSFLSTDAVTRRTPSLTRYDGPRNLSTDYVSGAYTLRRSSSRRRLTDDYDELDVSDVYPDVPDVEEIRRRARLAARRSPWRAASMSRIETVTSHHHRDVASQHRLLPTRPLRAASVSRASSIARSSLARASSGLPPPYYVGVTSTSDSYYRPVTDNYRNYYSKEFIGDIGRSSDRLDIASYVLQPGERFVPTDVSVSVLPSGKKAVTYTRFSQKGHGNQREANSQIDRVIQRTSRMLNSMHTLENFVKRNRHLFPEDIIIYQHIVFYLLDEAELKRLGERRADAEVYGVKIRERLVAPIGSDVASILRRYYSKHSEVEVEYLEREDIRRRLRDEVGDAPPSSSSPYVRRQRHYEDEVDEETTTRRRRRQQQESPDSERHVRRRMDSRERSLYIDEDSLISNETARTNRRWTKQETAPYFTLRVQPKRVRVGDMIRLSCSVSGEPEPTVTWYRSGQEITDNGRYHITNDFGLCSLKINDAQKGDAGLYTATAANAHGQVSSSAELIVEVDVEPMNVDTGRQPWFLIDAQNTSAETGQRAVLEAQATGRPPPTFRWKKDNVDVMLDSRVRAVSDDLGNTKLVIRDIKTTDAGVYFCIAENSLGKAKCAATLRVTDSDQFNAPGRRRATSSDEFDVIDDVSRRELPSYQLPVWSAPGGHRPQFVQVPPTRVEVFEGDPLTLRCVVEGEPKPVVTWYKGVRELTYSERHRVLAEGNGRYMMQVKSALQTDPGEYTAVATNSFGQTKFTVFVSVLPRPEQDYEFLWNRPMLPEREYELVKRMEQGKMPPMFIKRLPRERTVKVGETLVLNCRIEEAKMREYLVGIDVVVKEKAKDGSSPKPANKASLDSSKEKTAELSQVADVVVKADSLSEVQSAPNTSQTPGTSSTPVVNSTVDDSSTQNDVTDNTTVKAVDGLQPDSTPANCEQQTVSGKDLSRNEGPVFQTLLQSQTVPAGSAVTLECIINSDAKPTINWLKNGSELTAQQGVQLETVDQLHRLTISKARPTDAGLYTIHASNEHGNSSASATVTVWPAKSEKRADVTFSSEDEDSESSVSADEADK